MNFRNLFIIYFHLFTYLFASNGEKFFPITGGLHNVIKIMHALRKKKEKKQELHTSQYNTY